MNILDILVIIIMLLNIALGIRRGFIRSMIGLINFILAIILTNILYPPVGRFLRGIDGLYNALSTSIRQNLGLDALIEGAIYATQTEIINSLPLPQILRNALIENNNPIIHDALQATDFAGYIAGFLAGIAINIITLVAVFILLLIGLNLFCHILDLIAKLPVLNSLNKLLGAILGAVWGLLINWVALGIIVIYFTANGNAQMNEMLETSQLASRLHDANFVVGFILRLFP